MRKVMVLALAIPLLGACTTVSQVATKMARAEDAEEAGFSDKAQDSLYLGVIEGLIKQGRCQAALAFLDEYHQTSPRAAVLRGDALIGAGYPYQAVPAYKLAINSSYAAAAFNGMGRAQSAQGGWAEAVESFRRASAIEPANADYLNNLGYAQLRSNVRYSAAVARDNLKRAHELDPGSVTIRNNLILAAKQLNDHAEVTALLGEINDGRLRRKVAAFSDGWSGNQGDVTNEEGTP